MLVLNSSKNDGLSMQQEAKLYSAPQPTSLYRGKHRHDPSVREWASQVIKADKTDHLGLINHSLLMPESSPTPFVDLSWALMGLFPLSPLGSFKNCNKSYVLIICTDYMSKVQLRLSSHSSVIFSGNWFLRSILLLSVHLPVWMLLFHLVWRIITFLYSENPPSSKSYEIFFFF